MLVYAILFMNIGDDGMGGYYKYYDISRNYIFSTKEKAQQCLDDNSHIFEEATIIEVVVK